MTSVRALLTRVARLEAARSAPRSPFEITFGSFGMFEDKVLGDIDARKLDGVDGPLVLLAVQKWHRDGLWGGWRYNLDGSPQYASQ